MISRIISKLPNTLSIQNIAIIDISGSDLNILVYNLNKNNLEYKLLYSSVFTSFGFVNSIIENIEVATKDLAIIFDKIEKTINKKINNVVLNAPFSQITSSYKTVKKYLNRVLTQQDISDLLQVSNYERSFKDDIIISVTVEDIIIDNQKVLNPFLRKSKNLEIVVNIVSIYKPYAKALYEVFQHLSLNLIGIVYVPRVFLYNIENENNLNYCVIDINEHEVLLSTYIENNLYATFCLSFGYNKLYEMLSSELKLDITVLKKLFSRISDHNRLQGKIIEITYNSALIKFSYNNFLSHFK